MGDRRHLTRLDLERMNLPEEFWKAKVQEVSPSVQDEVIRYLTSIEELTAQGVGLLVTGNVGVGKTAIAALALKEGRAQGLTAFFASVWELREAIRSRIAFDEDMSVWDRVQEVDLLVLDSLLPDDVDESFLGVRAITELVASRSRRGRSSVITTRMDTCTVSERMPGLVASCTWVLLSVEGPNLRELRADRLDQLME